MQNENTDWPITPHFLLSVYVKEGRLRIRAVAGGKGVMVAGTAPPTLKFEMPPTGDSIELYEYQKAIVRKN